MFEGLSLCCEVTEAALLLRVYRITEAVVSMIKIITDTLSETMEVLWDDFCARLHCICA